MKKLIAFLALLFLPIVASAQTCPTPAQLDTDLTAADQDDVISLSGVNPLTCPEVSMTQTWAGGKLIFSDSPESPTTKGKLYADDGLPATSGTDYHRVYLYHTNGKASGRMKFTVLLTNTSASSGTLTVQKKGTAGPSTSYLYAGKLAYHRWLTSTAASGVSVAAGATVRLDSTFDTTTAASTYLMHGIWDYSFTQTHKIEVCALDEFDAQTSCSGLSVLTRDASHQRGTFPYCDKVYDTASGVTVDTASGVQQFPLAGNTTNDGNATGTDDTDGTSMTLVGNYGINYRAHLALSASDSQNFGILINPRGGAWGGAIWTLAGITAGGKFLIPATTASVSANTSGAVAGKWSPGAALTVWFQFMPTGGSSFPLRFVLVPH